MDLATVKQSLHATGGVSSPQGFNGNGRTNAMELAIVRRALNLTLPLPTTL